jgi:hypothetical protein
MPNTVSKRGLKWTLMCYVLLPVERLPNRHRNPNRCSRIGHGTKGATDSRQRTGPSQ